MKSLKFTRILSNTLIYAILIVMSVIWLAPLVWLILQSFGAGGIKVRAQLIPEKFTFDNYIWLFSNFTNQTNPLATNHTLDGQFFGWFCNTLIVAILTCIINTIFVLGTAYGLSRFRFKSRDLFMRINLIIGMFPGFLGMIIMYWVMRDIFHLQGNYFALVILYTAGAGGGYYIAKGFFDTISKSLDVAAMIDGANKNTIFWRVIMPLSKPIVVYTILLAFTAPWGDYMFASVIAAGDSSLFNVAVGLQQLLTKESGVSGFPIFCAAGVIVSIPIMTLFFFLQGYYVEGVTGGAVKG